MSWRKEVSAQPDTPNRQRSRIPANEVLLLILHLGYMLRCHALQKLRRLRQVEFRVARFDAQEKPVGRSMGKTFHVENRVVWLRQPVQRQHTDNGKNRRTQHRQFKRDWNKCGPT